MTLPLARNGILAGLVLAFARALGEFGATLMLAGNIPGKTATVPLAIYTAVQTGEEPTALAAGRRCSPRCPVWCSSPPTGSGRAARHERRASRSPSRQALPGFTLDVAWTAGGGVAVLFGPSGAGKTLTLSVPGRADPAGRGAHRRRRARLLRQRGRDQSSRAGAGASATSSRATRSSRTSPWRTISASACAIARAPSARAGWREVVERLGLGWPRAALSTRAVGWPAAAGGAGARAGHRAGAAAARRAAVRARRAAAPRAARRAAPGPERGGHRGGGGHPRLHRGLSAGRPHRGLRRRARHPVGAARRAAVAAGLGVGGAASWGCPTCCTAPSSRPRPIASSSAGAARSWRP